MSRIAAAAATGLAAAVVLAGPAVAADKCLDQVRDLAARYGASSKPPTAAPNGKSAVTTQDLAGSGGVIKPPPVQDKAVITPPPDKHDPMPTVPDVATNTNKRPEQGPQQGSEAKHTQLQAALTAARAQAERGDEKGCEEALDRARMLADRTN